MSTALAFSDRLARLNGGVLRRPQARVRGAFDRKLPTPPRRPRPASGILFRYTDAEGAWYLLGKRTRRLGGTWSNIGGSIENGEDALASALREVEEEINLRPAALGGRVAGEVQCGTLERPYTLFLVDVPDAFDGAVLNWEHDDLAWWHCTEVTTLNLHDGFRRGWEAFA